jgi:hypothetical protein
MTTYLPFGVRHRVTGIHEHTRTISGRRDPVSGAVTMDSISLGYFMHIDMAGGIAIQLGPTPPEDLKVGDEVIVSIRKADPA